MVKYDFTMYRSFVATPVWWQNFILCFVTYAMPAKKRDKIIELEIGKFNGKISDNEDDSEQIDYLEFDTEEDFKAFKIFWTIYGK